MESILQRHVGIKCRQCGERMDIVTVRKYGNKWGPWLIGAGMVLTLLGGLIAGVLCMLVGTYVVTAKETTSCCPDCGYFFRVSRSFLHEQR